MKGRYFVERELQKRGRRLKVVDGEACADAMERLLLEDEAVLEKETETQQQAPAEQAEKERRSFNECYEAYIHPPKPMSALAEQDLLDEMYLLLKKHLKQWTYEKAARYRAVFSEVDEELALEIGCTGAYFLLRQDKEEGNTFYSTDKKSGGERCYALAHYIKVAKNTTISEYFRKEFRRLRGESTDDEQNLISPPKKTSKRPPHPISLDALQTNAEGESMPERGLGGAVDPFEPGRGAVEERDALCYRLGELYMRCLLGYEGEADKALEPQKPIALMYGSVLYQLAKEATNESALVLAAKSAAPVTSVTWAQQAMGQASLRQLGNMSERVLSRYYGSNLRWGKAWRARLAESSDPLPETLWGDIVYTAHYSADQTSDWIESIRKTMIQKTARLICGDAELREFAMQTMGEGNRLCVALKKLSKEERS